MGMGMDEDVDMGGGEDTEGDDEEELSSRTETVKEMEKERGKEARKSGGGRKSIGGGEENRARGGGGGGDRKRRKVKKSRVEIDAKGYTGSSFWSSLAARHLSLRSLTHCLPLPVSLARYNMSRPTSPSWGYSILLMVDNSVAVM